MKTWDLAAGAGKLELGLKSLQIAADDIGQSWDDDAYRRFVDSYLTPLEPRVRTLLDAVRRLAEVLANAERQCRSDEGHD